MRRPRRRLYSERVGQALRGLSAVAIVQVAHRRLDVGVADPRLDLDDVGAGDRERAKGVAQVVEAQPTQGRRCAGLARTGPGACRREPGAIRRELVRAGVIRGMELDINPDWPVFATYDPAGGHGPATPSNGHLLAATVRGPDPLLPQIVRNVPGPVS